MRKLLPVLAALVAVGTMGIAHAQDAGSENEGASKVERLPHPANCTFTKAVLCKNGSGCEPADTLGDLPLPARFLLHFERRIIAATGPDKLPHVTKIRALARAGDHLVLQGVSGPASWTIQSSMKNGGTSFVTASNHTVLSAFGHCEVTE